MALNILRTLKPKPEPKPEQKYATDFEDLKIFVKEFKQKRLKLGFMQEDVALAIGKLYGCDYSQTTISRFEAFRLSTSNMYKLKPFLQHWLECAGSVKDPDSTDPIPKSKIPMPVPINRKRRKRTKIPNEVWMGLEKAFQENPKPSPEEIIAISDKFGSDTEVVRVWFANRRQKEKRARFENSSTSPYAISVDCPEYSQSPGTDISTASNNSEHSTEGQENSTSNSTTCSNIVILECPQPPLTDFSSSGKDSEQSSKIQVNSGFKTYIIVSPSYSNTIKLECPNTSESTVSTISEHLTNGQNTTDPRAYCFASL